MMWQQERSSWTGATTTCGTTRMNRSYSYDDGKFCHNQRSSWTWNLSMEYESHKPSITSGTIDIQKQFHTKTTTTTGAGDVAYTCPRVLYGRMVMGCLASISWIQSHVVSHGHHSPAILYIYMTSPKADQAIKLMVHPRNKNIIEDPFTIYGKKHDG